MARPTKRRRTLGSVTYHKRQNLYFWRYRIGDQRKGGYAKTKVGENIFGKSKYGYTGTGAQSMAGGLLSKAKNALPSSIDPMNSAQATAGVWNPDTSPLQSVATNTTAGPTSGQAGYGRDPNEDLIRSLGLSLLSDQYRASQQLFGA